MDVHDILVYALNAVFSLFVFWSFGIRFIFVFYMTGGHQIRSDDICLFTSF